MSLIHKHYRVCYVKTLSVLLVTGRSLKNKQPKEIIMRSLSILLAILSTTVMFSSCTSMNKSKFVGCFAFEDSGQAELKITKNGKKYFVSAREEDGWSKPAGLHPGSTEEFKSLFGEDAERVKAKLIADEGAFGMFLVNPGEVYAGKKAKTK